MKSTKENYKKMMTIDHVIPGCGTTIQNVGLQCLQTADGWDIRLVNQLANSPDTNVSDSSGFLQP